MSKYKEAALALIFAIAFLGMTWGWLSISDSIGTVMLTVLFMGFPGIFLLFFAAYKLNIEFPKVMFGIILIGIGGWLFLATTIPFIAPIILLITGISFVVHAIFRLSNE